VTVLLDGALRYAAGGRPVFPCRSRGKQPATRNGLRDATTDTGLIAGWWEATPDANVAIRTGAPSRIVVVDVDGDEGMDSLHELEAAEWALPRTASVVTPGRGQHFYFRHPGVTVPNSARAVGAAIDVRSDGGYVLAPPSVGAGGRRYEPDERAAIAPLPEWLLERLARPAGAKRPASPSRTGCTIASPIGPAETRSPAREVPQRVSHGGICRPNRVIRTPMAPSERLAQLERVADAARSLPYEQQSAPLRDALAAIPGTELRALGPPCPVVPLSRREPARPAL